MVTIVLGDDPGDDRQRNDHDPQPCKESTPREPLVLTAQHQNITGEDADIEQDNHRRSEQGEIKYVACRRNDRGQNYDYQDRIPAVADEKSRTGHLYQRQQEQEDRNLEDNTDPEHHIDEKIVVFRDVDRRIDAFADTETQQEFEAVAKGNEIGEKAAHDKQAGARNHERNSPAALAFIQSGSDEG